MMPPVVLIAGMHRSGTSMLTSVLRDAGVDVGDELIGPARGNRRGHFEDAAFVAFHDQVLSDAGQSMYLAWPARPPGWRDAHRSEAVALLRRRASAAAAGVPWGWKDPRTTLFLDDWERVANQLGFGACVIVAWRPWRAVVDSLRRRGDAPLRYEGLGAPTLRRMGFNLFKAERAAAMWRLYNAVALSFVERHSETSLVIETASLAETWEGIAALLSGRLGVELDTGAASRLVEPSLMVEPESAHPRGIKPGTAAALDEIERQLAARSVRVDPPSDDQGSSRIPPTGTRSRS